MAEKKDDAPREEVKKGPDFAAISAAQVIESLNRTIGELRKELQETQQKLKLAHQHKVARRSAE